MRVGLWSLGVKSTILRFREMGFPKPTKALLLVARPCYFGVLEYPPLFAVLRRRCTGRFHQAWAPSSPRTAGEGFRSARCVKRHAGFDGMELENAAPSFSGLLRRATSGPCIRHGHISPNGARGHR